uniref:Vipericidin n=1 Tax=Pelodiscus sinensis TaxID=13735 RepID=K7FKZ5_PELSI
MESGRRHLLLLVVGGAAVAAAEPSPHKTLSYEEAVALAVDFYNQGSGLDHAFRLLKADPRPEWDMTANPRQELKFTVKETVCLVAENLPGTECDFRDDGVVRDCSGFFSTQQVSPIVVVSCNTVAQEPTHIRRSRSPRRKWTWKPRRRGSYTLISQGGNKGKHNRLQMA